LVEEGKVVKISKICDNCECDEFIIVNKVTAKCKKCGLEIFY